MTPLTPSAVNELFAYCLYETPPENVDEAIKVEGITMNIGFDPTKIAIKKEEIKNLLMELPENFQETKGGGWSFLQACYNKHDELWSGEHRTMEELFILGTAAGFVKLLLPRELWSALPGGVPYYSLINLE